jgi:hypothetical protein
MGEQWLDIMYIDLKSSMCPFSELKSMPNLYSSSFNVLYLWNVYFVSLIFHPRLKMFHIEPLTLL